MRLTHVIISEAAAFMNPLRLREITLRGFKIPAVENLGATLDQFDVIDLSDNEIQKLENFPLLKRLRKIFVANNHVNRVSEKLTSLLPNLDTLILSNNRIANFSVIDSIGLNSKLEMLSLLENPVTRRPNYRLYTIFKIPSLTVLDFQKVTAKEREAAEKMFGGDASGQTFVPGEEVEEEPVAGLQAPAPAAKPTPAQINALRSAIANASTPAEIERLERALRAGIIPDGIMDASPAVADTDMTSVDDEAAVTKAAETEAEQLQGHPMAVLEALVDETLVEQLLDEVLPSLHD
jgi:U2 small nuclear ribonucleoprotein A'